ncbi:SRPBCC domain-containing protein [Mycobacteroides immunogenum]|uniref:SRPBCC family protein n=1 Tax=Mycobacteroides immunogenum TaxID=83262 RepID=UPI0025B739F9|nr:SRPBCC domain-containing protein [Mycobacteroides immunogenum]WJR34159.1 SRPBCC domain-containing protein [Mycobacteroides immunogenum]
MILFERSFVHPPPRVWQAMVDPDLWSLQTNGFRPEVGCEYRITHPAIMGTRLLGTGHCTVVAADPGELLAVEFTGAVRAGDPAHWTISHSLAALDGGTTLTTYLDGVDINDHSEKVLLRVVTDSTARSLHVLQERLNRTTGC